MKTNSETQHLQYNVGVIVGRFQVPILHDAHFDLINSVLEKHPRTIIFLGVSKEKFTVRDPLPFESRKHLIESSLHSSVLNKVTILPIQDKNNNEDWVKQLDEFIDILLLPNEKPLLYGSRDSFIDIYKSNGGMFNTEELISEQIVSGTEVRFKVAREIIPSEDFRKGIIYCIMNK